MPDGSDAILVVVRNVVRVFFAAMHGRKAVAPVAFTAIPADLCRMKDVPAWIFHDSADERVPAGRAKKLAAELRACGGGAKLTIFPAEGHDAWTEAYRTRALFEWLLRQRR